MRKLSTIFAVMIFTTTAFSADINVLRSELETSKTALNSALNATRDACLGISEDLNHLKTLAGIGTGVSAVGVVGAGTAGTAGLVKNKYDKKAMEFGAPELWEQIQTNAKNNPTHKKIPYDKVNEFTTWFNTISSTPNDHKTEIEKTKQALRQATEAGLKGEKMGNLRTGTLAASAALNITGAATSGVDMKHSKNVTDRISECADATQKLNIALMQLKLNKSAYDSAITESDNNSFDTEEPVISDTEIKTIQNIITKCDEWSTVYLSKIEKQSKGALASNIIGATTGTAGTITSVLANTDKTRLSGTNQEKNLNTTSNIMSAGTAVASITATIFNGSQINKIKQASTVADACEEALK
jgi:hypothetical protein